ncbi:hypothetical protein NHX12_003688 [Muraenolepis orangiensis]|uniref:Uncharacterized protein n=1 Tax=Muraenolepis orangiensis TaxID=630683 RepID=A0A9Q0DTV9_9TELE|nr:hypothetical protein NHX12_003688 [Muraenolepis orangiensis]
MLEETVIWPGRSLSTNLSVSISSPPLAIKKNTSGQPPLDDKTLKLRLYSADRTCGGVPSHISVYLPATRWMDSDPPRIVNKPDQSKAACHNNPSARQETRVRPRCCLAPAPASRPPHGYPRPTVLSTTVTLPVTIRDAKFTFTSTHMAFSAVSQHCTSTGNG